MGKNTASIGPSNDLPLSYFDKRMASIQSSSDVVPIEPGILHPNWLVNSDFYSDIWHWLMPSTKPQNPTTISFHVLLPDAKYLTDPKHSRLLLFLKLFIAAQFHPKFTNGKAYKASTAGRILRDALHVCDWLLLRYSELDVGRLGLELLTVADVVKMLSDCGRFGIWNGIYDVDSKLVEWLREGISGLPSEAYETIIDVYPSILILPSSDERSLDMTDAEIILARVYMMHSGQYIYKNEEYTLHTSPFIQKTYAKNTLHGKSLTPIIPVELRFGENMGTEYEAVPVRQNNSDGISSKAVSQKLACFKKLMIVDAHYLSLGLNGNDISKLSTKHIVLHEPKKLGRYMTLPFYSVFKAMRQSIEFFLEHGKRVLDAMLDYLKHVHSNGVEGLFSPSLRIADSFSGSNLNISQWLLLAGPDGRRNGFFETLREFPGLAQAYRLTLATMQIVVGALMARRQGELTDLLNSTCLYPALNPHLVENESVEYFLYFGLEKTGSSKSLLEVNRPLPTIAAKMIWTLQEFNNCCIQEGWLRKSTTLFNAVNVRSLSMTASNAKTFNGNLDIFSDYFETATITWEDAPTQRFYIRQHQLRRFFAQAFHFGDSADNLLPLSYMLGHGDIQDLHHYITEMYPGEVLASVKAEHISAALLSSSVANIENLAVVRKLLEDRFNTNAVSLKSFSEIYDDYSYQVDVDLVDVGMDANQFVMNTKLEDDLNFLVNAKLLDLEAKFFTVEGSDSMQVRFYVVVREKLNG